MTAQSRFLFVYGTLRRGGGHPMARLLSRHMRSVVPATVPGRLFDTGRYPAAVPSSETGDVVHGELCELDSPDEVWEWLDEYERYFPGDEGNSLFVRRLSPVTPGAGETLQAWMYWYNRPVDGLERLVSGRYE